MAMRSARAVCSIIEQRLAHAHHDDVAEPPRRRSASATRQAHRARPSAGRRSRRRADCARAAWSRYGRTSRSGCSRPGSRCTPRRDRARGCRRSRPPARRRSAAAICACHRRIPGRRRRTVARCGSAPPAGRAGLRQRVIMAAIGGAPAIEPVPQLARAHRRGPLRLAEPAHDLRQLGPRRPIRSSEALGVDRRSAAARATGAPPTSAATGIHHRLDRPR